LPPSARSRAASWQITRARHPDRQNVGHTCAVVRPTPLPYRLRLLWHPALPVRSACRCRPHIASCERDQAAFLPLLRGVRVQSAQHGAGHCEVRRAYSHPCTHASSHTVVHGVVPGPRHLGVWQLARSLSQLIAPGLQMPVHRFVGLHRYGQLVPVPATGGSHRRRAGSIFAPIFVAPGIQEFPCPPSFPLRRGFPGTSSLTPAVRCCPDRYGVASEICEVRPSTSGTPVVRRQRQGQRNDKQKRAAGGRVLTLAPLNAF